MNNKFKALLGAAIVSSLLIGCESTQTRADADTECADKAAYNSAECKDKANYTEKKEDCAMSAKSCGEDCTKPCCADKANMACGTDCTKPCCAG